MDLQARKGFPTKGADIGGANLEPEVRKVSELSVEAGVWGYFGLRSVS